MSDQHRPGRRTFLVAAAASAAIAARSPVRAQGLTTIRVAANPVEAYAQPYYADELGLLTKAGFSVEFLRSTSGAAALQAVLTGAADVGISSIVQIANAYLVGVRYAYFAGGPYVDAVTKNSIGICVAKDSPIRSARDLEGKTVSVASVRDGTHLMFAAYLQRAGVDLAKVNFVELPFPAQPAALTSGRIAAGLCVEPFMPGAIDEIRLLASGTETIGPKFATAGWLGTPKWINENRSVAHRFAAVMYDTARWANDNANTARKNEILAKITKMEPAMLTRMVHATYSVALNPAEFEPWLEWAYRVKFIDKPVHARDLIERV
jgi:NitT/TauT family transport system substrate-binding protein